MPCCWLKFFCRQTEIPLSLSWFFCRVFHQKWTHRTRVLWTTAACTGKHGICYANTLLFFQIYQGWPAHFRLQNQFSNSQFVRLFTKAVIKSGKISAQNSGTLGAWLMWFYSAPCILDSNSGHPYFLPSEAWILNKWTIECILRKKPPQIIIIGNI